MYKDVKFTIITVVKNGENYIGDCVKSVTNQTYENYEHLIFDGNSKDATIDIIKRTKGKNTKFYSREDNGLYDALNSCAEYITGNFVILLHADDIFHSADTLKNLNNIIGSSVGKDLYLSSIEMINTSGRVIRYWDPKRFQSLGHSYGWVPPHTGITYVAETFKKYLPFSEEYSISADYDFLIRMFKGSVKFEFTELTLINMRIGGMSTSMRNQVKTFHQDLGIAKKNKIPVIAIIMKRLIKLFQFR